MDYTTRLKLSKPNSDPVTGDFLDVDVLNDNFDKLDAALGFTMATSGAPPSSPYAGRGRLNTDDGKAYVWGGSAWKQLLIAGAAYDGNIGLGTAPDPSPARRIKTYWSGTTGALSHVLLEQSGAASGSRALGIKAGGEANERWWLDFDGKMQWGPGTSGGDVTAGRSGSGTLDVSPSLTVGGVRPGSVVSQTFTGNGTWTKPAGAKQVWVRMVGGGGGGGGASSPPSGQGSKGGGGGAGEYVEKWFDASALNATEAVTVGAGGSGVSGANGNGGSTSTFKGISAAGGLGGGHSAPNAANTFGISGGDGGSGGAGAADLRCPGAGGDFGVSGPGLASGGAGGSSTLGGGGKGTSSGGSGASTQGADALGYGGGGGGAQANNTGSAAQRGGNGKAGVVIITTFF